MENISEKILEFVDNETNKLNEENSNWLKNLYDSLNEQLQVKPLLNTEESEK